ncbi:MAG: hypothetical protein KDC66_23555 [Phaeodactylibacter sp.]|nr:hypothetical protein [Phaeodactylibacter sp.]MCB9273228.1 hypothetical protein [Lewinellaceae bacterium]
MKTFRFFILSFVCLMAGSFAFATPPAVQSNTELRREVAKMIQAPELSKHGICEAQVYVCFTVDENNEIVVLDVVADNDYLKEYVAKSLNKQKIDTEGVEAYAKYGLKVAFRSEKAESA